MMRPACSILMASLMVLACGSGCKDRSGSDNSDDQAEANAPVEIQLSPPLPCWSQSWNCGTWRPLTYKPKPELTLPLGIADAELALSTCAGCSSFRLVNWDDQTERIALSREAREVPCLHEWRPGFCSYSLETIEPGDAVFILYNGKMYVLVLKHILGDPVPYQEISYRIAEVCPDNGVLSTNVAWKTLAWKERSATESMTLGERDIKFCAQVAVLPNRKLGVKYITIKYDYNYHSLPMEETGSDAAHIAIVHKAYLESHPVVELAKFRFKTWEDGLGNWCESDGSDNEGQSDY